MSIAILLATYNGETYLQALLESLQAQSVEDFTVLISDDGSTDNSLAIVNSFECSDSRFQLLNLDVSRKDRGGPCGNFGRLMSAALDLGFKACFFCDQDDVWHRDKLHHCMQALADIEGEAPCLVVCEYDIVRGKSTIVRSLPRRVPFSTLEDICSRNIYPGCTLAFNRSALELAMPFPNSVIMHDWWVTLLVSAAGTVRRVEQPLVHYRIHDGNVVGIPHIGAQLLRALAIRRSTSDLKLTFDQAAAAANRLSERLSSRQDLSTCSALTNYSNLPELPIFRALLTIASSGIRSESLMLRCSFILHFAAFRLLAGLRIRLLKIR